MKTIVSMILGLFIMSSFASAATPLLWAFDVGYLWGGSEASYSISLDPFTPKNAAYPSGAIETLGDAAYVLSSSTLYISGGNPGLGEPWYYQNTIAVYSGGPGALTLISSSNAGTSGHHGLRGIEYVDESLYAIAYTGSSPGIGNVLLRIDNPGIPSQTVTQIGPPLDAVIGIPQALCKDGGGDFFAVFGSTLYRIDSQVGEAALLHTYSTQELGGQPFLEGLIFTQNRLFGVTTAANVFEIDTETYVATKLGELDGDVWTALVAIPEPSILVLMASGMLGLLILRKRG